MESNKKKTLILMIVAVTVFVALIIGATYAYYSVNVSRSNAKTTITAQTEGGGSIVLTTPVTDLKLELLGDEMDENNKNKEYYATTKDDSKGYADSLETGTHNIANIELASSTEGGKYDCSANVKVTLDINSLNSMGAVLHEKDLMLNIIGYPELDLYKLHDTGEDTIPVTFTVKSGTPTVLQMYAKLTNKNENQNYLADKELNITVETQDLQCSVVKPFVTGTGAELAHSGHEGLTEEPIGDLYRYIGTADNEPDNYICFGTTGNCYDNDNPKENYQYRIIGVDTNGRVKLIKDTAISTSTQWHNNYKDNAVWDVANSGKLEAELHQKLNGSTFLDNQTYVPTSSINWKDKIDDTNWYIGDSNGDTATAGDAIWTWEQKTAVTTPSKIGLMYLSDYYYALDGTGNKNCRSGGSTVYGECKKAWIHLTNNGLSQNYNEWTISRYGLDSSIYAAWRVYSDGDVTWTYLNNTSAVRPVFYLKSSVKITGEGTKSNPYILSA